jgi:hypothetical protein
MTAKWTQLAAIKTPTAVRLEESGEGLWGAVAVHLEEGGGSTAIWHVRVYALLDTGKVLAAEFDTTPPPAANPARAMRVVATVRIPGARSWHADFSLVSGAAAGTPKACLTPDECCSGNPCDFPNERWGYLSGVVGLVSVPAGARVQRIGAMSNAGGALQVDAWGLPGNPVVILAGTGVTLSPEGKLQGPVDILFTTTDSYVIEYTYG